VQRAGVERVIGLPTSLPLPGGVSCDVFIERDATGREIVVKQALPRLKVVADWRSDPERSRVEVRALKAMRELLGVGIVPEVLWEDAANHRFAMERIDPRLRNWKSELMSGRVDIVTASRVGELLGLLHTRSATQLALATEFATREYFEQLRIDPFFTRIAQRNPGLTPGVSEAIAALRAPGEALVHGDYSPKNLLVDGAEVVILDFEVAHWGNPRFDIAFCLAHLMLKGVRDGVSCTPYAEAARAFLSAYKEHGLSHSLDAMLVQITGCMLLARLEGDSPVDYREQLNAIYIKAAASAMIVHPVADVNRAVERFFADP
jgi:5-methylthioribose kinase